MMLKVLEREAALRLVRAEADKRPLETEKVSAADALGRVLAKDVISPEDVPAFDRSTVDGFAVFSADTFGAGNAVPAQLDIVGEIRMGEKAGFSLARGTCAAIPTGGMLPDGADAVVMVEHTDSENGLCLVYKPAAPSQNVTARGDDVAEGETALRAGTRVGPAGAGVLAALGITEVEVFRRPVVAVISTGDEIISSGTPGPGQIRDVNRPLLRASAEKLGCRVLDYGAVADDRARIENAVAYCAEHSDLVLISGGSSAGARDMTAAVTDKLGEVLFHGLAMKPGKPTIFGTALGTPVFGLPGHPLAAYFVFRLVAAEYLRRLMKMPEDSPRANGRLGVNVPSNHGREEFVCVGRGANGELVPLHTKSGIISVLSGAVGFIRVPRNAEGLEKGTVTDIYDI